MNFYFSQDDDAGNRNSVGVIFVVQAHIPGVLMYCDEYDTFWRSLSSGTLDHPIQIKKNDFRPATLAEINDAGLLTSVHGVSGDSVTLKVGS